MAESVSLFEKYGPWALIAGGSEGIGKSFAEMLATAGFNLILLARKESVLQETTTVLRERYPVEICSYAFDLTAPDLESRIQEIIKDRDIGLLIYNAGGGDGCHPFLDQRLEYLQQLIRLNCEGPLVLAHSVGNRLRQRGGGGMIMLSSMGAFYGSAYIAAYAATKAFDIVFAEGLWAELRSANIDVLSLVVGATDTPAMYRIDANFKTNTDTANGDSGRPVLMSSDQVAREGLEHLGAGSMHIAGEFNREIVEVLRKEPRQDVIEIMSGASAALYNRPWPDVYR